MEIEITICRDCDAPHIGIDTPPYVDKDGNIAQDVYFGMYLENDGDDEALRHALFECIDKRLARLDSYKDREERNQLREAVFAILKRPTQHIKPDDDGHDGY